MDDAANSPLLRQVPIEITVTVGSARPAVSDLLGMGEGAVLALDRRVDDPVELFIGDRLIARGTLQELEDGQPGFLGVCLTELVDLRDVL